MAAVALVHAGCCQRSQRARLNDAKRGCRQSRYDLASTILVPNLEGFLCRNMGRHLSAQHQHDLTKPSKNTSAQSHGEKWLPDTEKVRQYGTATLFFERANGFSDTTKSGVHAGDHHHGSR